MSAIVETMKTEPKYGSWLWVLKLFGKKYAGWTNDTVPSPSAWRHFYDDGVEPFDALKIDINERQGR